MNKSSLLKLLPAVLLFFIVLFVMNNVFPVVKNAFYNIDFALKKSKPPRSVVIAGIDGRSVSDIGVWPWPREETARLIDSIRSAGAKTIALDMIFPERDEPRGDSLLEAVFSKTAGLAGGFRAEGLYRGRGRGKSLVPLEARGFRFNVEEKPGGSEFNMIYSAENIIFGENRFSSKYSRAGFLNVPAELSDQNVRSSVHVIRAGNDCYPSLAIAAASEYLNIEKDSVILDLSGSIFIGNRRVRIDPLTGSARINFYGETGVVETVSASDILRGREAEKLKGKLVFVGITDAASSSADVFTTPVGRQFPGVEIWATVSANIIENDMFFSGNVINMTNIALVLIIFPGLALFLFLKGRKPVFIMLCAALLGTLLINPILFIKFNIFWDPSGHIAAGLFLLGWIILFSPETRVFISESLNLEPDEAEVKTLRPPSENQFLQTIPAYETSRHAVDFLRSEVPEEEVISRFVQLAGGRIIRTLGRGGMADVYLIWNPELEVYRAVKVIKPGEMRQKRERFETEVKISANLEHTNIVSCYGTGEWCGLSYIEMEYVRSVSFDRVLSKFGKLTPEETAGAGIIVGRALHYAHRRTVSVFNRQYNGVVHRDIKPSNILFCRSGKIKITDFGIARPGAADSLKREPGVVMGTLPYLAPEQLESEAGPKSDIYSLGTVLYEMISGRKAFPQNDIKKLVQAKKAGVFEPLSGSVYGNMASIIHRAMMLRPQERYDNAGTLCEELENYLYDKLDDKKSFVFQGLLERILKK